MDNSTQIEKINSLATQALCSCEFKCNKVSFDLFKIKKLDTVYQTYRIQNGERIMAFSKASISLISLTIDGVVFTDKALYLHPNSAREMPSNRFAYSDLCDYLITQENERGSVHLQSRSADYRIYDSTLIFKNTAGKDILFILETIQDKLLASSQLAQAKYNEQVQWVLSLGKSEINQGVLSKRARALLDVLARKTSYKKDAIFLIAESIFRLCNRSKYQKYLDSVAGTISTSELCELRKASAQFMTTLLTQLSDLDHDFSEEYLTDTYLNIVGDCLKSDSAFSDFFNVSAVDEPYLHVLAYCEIRKNYIADSQNTISLIRKNFGDAHTFSIEYFKGVFRNRQMLCAYKAICAGKEIDKAWYSICDSYGLTLLHYALILKNDTVAAHILTILKTHKLPPPPENIDISWMYEYTLLVCGSQSKMKERVFLLFDPDIIALEKEMAMLKLKVVQCDLKLSGTSTMQSQCKSRIAYLEQNDPFSPELDNLYNQKEYLLNEYRTCLRNKHETEKELDSKEKQCGATYNESVRSALNKLDNLRSNEDPLAKLLFRLYFEPEFLYSTLTATSDQTNTKLYKYADLYFVAPDFADISRSLLIETMQKEDNKMDADQLMLDGFAPISPLHGTSWFSVNAHADMAVLKAEYRALAKQYHPDVCKHPDSNAVMQNITAEYESLLR